MDARRTRQTIWVWTIFLSLIGVAAVTRRLLSLTGALSAAGPKFGLEGGFARHATLTTIHIIPGLLFMVLAPLQFVERIRVRRPALHRWIGRTVVALGMVIGGSALVMSPQMAIGGPTETAATMLFGCLFLFAMIRGFLYIRCGNTRLHREWMIRAFAIGMAVAAVRPIVGVFFATSRLTHLTPREFFGIAFWLGFTIQAVAAEVWIRHMRSRRLARGISFSGAEANPRLARR